MSKKSNTLTWDLVERLLTDRLDHKTTYKKQVEELIKKKERTGKVYYRREVTHAIKD